MGSAESGQTNPVRTPEEIYAATLDVLSLYRSSVNENSGSEGEVDPEIERRIAALEAEARRLAQEANG